MISIITSILVGCTNNSISDSVSPTSHGQTINDEHALIVGVDHVYENLPVILKLQVNGIEAPHNRTTLFEKTLSSYDLLMKTIENQNQSRVFYDFTEEIRNVINNAAITYWLNIDDNYLDNHIVCYVTSLGGQITSAPFEIKGPGIWYLSTAKTDGGQISSYDWSNVVIGYPEFS